MKRIFTNGSFALRRDIFPEIITNCKKKNDCDMLHQQNCKTDSILKTFTAQDADTIIRRATNDPSAKVLEYSIKPYSTDTLGGLGSYWNLKITAKSTRTEELSFFLKSVPLNPKESLKDFMKECQVFKEESHFYENIFPFLTETYQGDKWSAACYLIKKDVLVMEDLRSKNFKLQERFFDKTDNLKATFKTVAQFHSCSILTEARIKAPLNEHYPNSFIEKVYARSGFPREWHLSGLNVIAAVAKNLGQDPEKLRENFELVYDFVKPSSKYRNVICHGDLWANNMMFDDVPKCVLVDFQTITYAPLVLDILQFLYLNTTREYRDKNEKSLIELYHYVLEETVQRSDKKVVVPKLKEVMTAYDDFRLFGVISACLYFPDILIKKESSKKKYPIGGDKVEFTLAAMESDAFFKTKMNEAVVEFAECCKKIVNCK